jgi:hypothetical protein
MQRPKLTWSVVGVALTLCACSLNTRGLSGDAGRTPVLVDPGDSRLPSSRGGGEPSGAGGSGGGGAIGGAGMDGSGGGGMPDAAGGSGGIDEDAAGGEPDSAGGSGGAADGRDIDGASDGNADGDAGGSGGTLVVVDAPEDRIVSAVGCADSTREGFISVNRYAGIAACTGAWTEPGLVTPQSYLPQCDHKAGNTGPITGGMGCSAADLCAPGWHVCESAEEVRKHAGDCDDAVTPSNSRPVFFATRQTASSTGCNTTGTSSIVGCGNIGARLSTTACDPLNARLGAPACFDNAPWQCGDAETSTNNELRIVTKPGLLRGGVLCCRG